MDLNNPGSRKRVNAAIKRFSDGDGTPRRPILEVANDLVHNDGEMWPQEQVAVLVRLFGLSEDTARKHLERARAPMNRAIIAQHEDADLNSEPDDEDDDRTEDFWWRGVHFVSSDAAFVYTGPWSDMDAKEQHAVERLLNAPYVDQEWFDRLCDIASTEDGAIPLLVPNRHVTATLGLDGAYHYSAWKLPYRPCRDLFAHAAAEGALSGSASFDAMKFADRNRPIALPLTTTFCLPVASLITVAKSGTREPDENEE